MSIGANRLLSVMASVGNDSASVMQSDIFSGTVTSVSPLAVTFMDNESRQITLSESFLTLAPTCRAKSINIPTIGVVQLWGNLAAGEKVTLLSFNRGQRYFVERQIL